MPLFASVICRRLLCCGLGFAGAALRASDLPPPAARPVDFVKDVQPILEKNCVKCHGTEKQKSDYRVDMRDVALKGGESHAPNIIPGKSAESPLIRFVAGLDEDMRMPPKGEPVSAEQIGILRRWIDDGAVWPESASVKAADPLDWWSLKPLVKPTVPEQGSGEHHAIDRFVSAKLAENGLAMASAADARTLCRRLYFDLIGLPPTPEELDAFELATRQDPSGAYARLVDQLLASPRYGERWARHWLDVVHYGDTHGYDKDQPRPNAWPYRDYVIRALNEDKPYARFVQEQLAGDVLFPSTRDGIEALGFIAAGPWDFIGHAELPEEKIDGKIARHLDRDDMVGNALGTFCSVTVQCAQCHNHKFDPITQEDYFALQAVFAALDRAERKYDLDPDVTARRAKISARIAELEVRESAFAQKIQKAAGPKLLDIETKLTKLEKSAPQGHRPEYGWHSAIEPKQETKRWVQVDLGKSTALDRVVLAGVWDDFNGIGAGFGFPVRFRVEASDDPEFGGSPQTVVAKDLEDFANPGTEPLMFAASGVTARFLRVTATKLAPRRSDYIFALAEVQVFDTTGKNVALGSAVSSPDSIEAPVRWTRKNLTDGIYPAATGGGEDIEKLRKRRQSMLQSVVDEATRRERQSNSVALEAARRELAALPPQKTVYAGAIHRGTGNFRGTGGAGGKPRAIHLLARGQVTQPGREVAPAGLSALKELGAQFNLPKEHGEGERRAALAKWITDPRHPLTWRSIVNRVWQYHFGRGLSDTPNDFGRMGGVPTHPELLDWLACEFRDHGGSLKHLHRLILTSAAYRQSSAVENAKAVQVDANNTFLWRQNRRKLEAEAIRDAVLVVSGKLDLTMGGPGWQDFVIKHPEHSPHYKYDLADPNDARTWRRSIYRFIVRSQMQPFMTSLDCADPSMRVDKRNESISAPQALAMLNNGFMVTQARYFAERLQKAGGTLEGQVDLACRLALGHELGGRERESLLSFAREHGLPNFCRVVLNLNEFSFID
jgi:hypothetical protein